MSRKLQRTLTIAATALALLALSHLPGSAASCPGAGTVKNAANALMVAARRNSVDGFAAALSRHADVNAISMFALGKYRTSLPGARRAEYVRKTHRYMSRFLADHAGRFKSTSALSVDRCNGNLVETSLGGRSRMVWRLSGSRVRDLRVEGFWLGLQMRSRFAEIIRRNDGDVGKLIDYLSRGQ